MLLIVHIPLILGRESLLLVWKLIHQLNLTRRWFQTLFIPELCLNFGTERQIKLNLLLGLIILVNWFPCLDTGHQYTLLHYRVKFWKMSYRWGCYEIWFLRILDKFHERICTVRYQTNMSVCLGLYMVLFKLLQPLPDLAFCTVISWWIGTRFPCRVVYPRVY